MFDEYNVKGLYVGVPVVIGKKGVEKLRLRQDKTQERLNSFFS